MPCNRDGQSMQNNMESQWLVPHTIFQVSFQHECPDQTHSFYVQSLVAGLRSREFARSQDNACLALLGWSERGDQSIKPWNSSRLPSKTLIVTLSVLRAQAQIWAVDMFNLLAQSHPVVMLKRTKHSYN